MLFSGCYFGGTNITAHILFAADAGNSHIISNCNFDNGAKAIQVLASTSEQVDGLVIEGNVFQGQTLSTLQLNSVLNCTISNNVDRSSPSAGSWITQSTHSSNYGDYIFNGNHWHPATSIPTFSATATYRWGNDTGIVMRNKGTYTTSSTTAASQAHGLSRTPTWCQGTPTANTGAFWNSVLNATNIGFTWATSGSPSWHWEAEV